MHADNTLRMRPYKAEDAKTIVTWLKDEATFHKWGSNRWQNFPITAEDMNRKYFDLNGDCAEADNFYPMTFFDGEGVAGHLIMRFTDECRKTLRLGFIVVDESKRGLGYGKKMLALSLKFAFELFGAERVTLGVFDCNMPAYYCYKAAGFKEVEVSEKETFTFGGEVWQVLELAMEREDYEKL